MARHWDRLGGLAGIGFVALGIAGIIAGGSVPKPDSPTARIVSYAVEHRSRILASCLLFGLATIPLLVFVAVLAFLLHRSDERSPASVITLVGGVVAAVTATVATLATATLAYRVGALGGSTTRMLFDLQNLSNTAIGFGVVVFLGGVVMGASRLALPAWLVPATWVVILAQLVSVFQIFPKSGAFAPGGGFTYAFFGLFMLWTLVTGVALVRGGGATVDRPVRSGLGVSVSG